MKAKPKFISPEVTEEMARLYANDRLTTLHAYLDNLPIAEWQPAIRKELQQFIDDTLKPRLEEYNVTSDAAIESFLRQGLQAVLKRTYESLQIETKQRVIWDVYDTLSVQDLIEAIVAIVLAEAIMEWSFSALPKTARAANATHRTAGEFIAGN